MRTFYVYILSNKRRTVLYVGMTNDLEHRVFQHKGRFNLKSFTAKYNCDQLVYFEEFNLVLDAIAREKCIKKYSRQWKENLINGMNPLWIDLAKDWFDEIEFEMYRKFDTE